MRNARKHNVAYSEFDMDEETWWRNFCCIILTVDDLSASIPSPNLKMPINIHGRITVRNNLPYPVNGADIAANNTGYGSNGGGVPTAQEKYSLMIYSVYNNRFMTLT